MKNAEPRRQRKFVHTVGLILLLVSSTYSQSLEEKLLGTFKWRNLGPGNFSGRIVDIEGLESDFRVVLVASASGGVWKSTNAGVTWQPVFDRYGSSSIGDVAVFQQNPDIIWVGTGEANNRNSVSWGDGIYRSDDGGATFRKMGLADTYQIARVVTHPTDPGIVYVASVGNLWGFSGQRGLFKTADGGATWEKLTNGLPGDNETGANDLVIDPEEPDTLYVSFYRRLRRPWRFDSGGPSGGIFKSVDAGRSWRRLSRGLPHGETGRIGLSIYGKEPRILMAVIEHGFQPRAGDPDYEDMSKPGSGIYRSEDGGETWAFLNRYNNRPFYYSQIRINPSNDQLVYVLTQSFQVSKDGGRTFETGGPSRATNYDYHAMWLDPREEGRYYLGGDKGAFLSHDQGEAYLFFGNLPVGQYYAVGVDMRDPYFIYGGTQDNGTWGGPSFARDARGLLNDHFWKLHWGDGMFIQVDPGDWRNVFTEAENGSLRYYNAQTRESEWRQPNPLNITNYSDYVPDSSPEPEAPQGRPRLPRERFRFNWSSPLVLSSHNPHILYLGGNHLFGSVDRGRTWRILSPDLTTNDPVKTDPESGGLTRDASGAETHCAITALSESPLMPGLIWVGTDDGRLHMTRDGGVTWRDVRANLGQVPEGIWVSSVEASHHQKETAYVTFDGHRSDDRTTWVFKTSDYGGSWRNIAGNLPEEQPVRIIREDPKLETLLFAGTEFGLYISIDGGRSWLSLMNGLPTVAVHDLTVHPRENDLIAATHGRGLWILDDITPLQQLSREVLDSNVFVFEHRRVTLWEDSSRGGQMGDFYFAGSNPPTVEPSTDNLPRARVRNLATLRYYLKDKPKNEVRIEITNLATRQKRTDLMSALAGINAYRWDLRFDSSAPEESPSRQSRPLATPGLYRVEITADGNSHSSSLTLRGDPISDQP